MAPERRRSPGQRASSSPMSPYLPALPSPPNAAGRMAYSAQNSPSPSLLRHSRVPEIADRPLNTTLPSLRDGVEHPEPYFMTQNVVLSVPDDQIPPWLLAHKESDRILLDFWRTNARFQDLYTDDFIRDAISAEIANIVGGQHSESQTTSLVESRINIWLDYEVISVEVKMLTEELVWETLWDEARKVSKDDLEELEAVYGKNKADSQMMKILKDNYMKPMRPKEGQPLLRRTWGELLYNLNRLMQRGSLVDNYAIKKLQEQIITQVAAKVVLDEALKFMEDEMANMDEDDRAENPPRHG